MTIYNLFEGEEENYCESEATVNEHKEIFYKKFSFWKSLGLRAAFLFAVVFCISWFLWACMAYLGWVCIYLTSPKKRALAKYKQVFYQKRLTLTGGSFWGCFFAAWSPNLGLSFLLAYFSVFSHEGNGEGIALKEFAEKIRSLSA